ncbi:hypothetical protein [Mesorhizobium captivum]|uniref:hypothetical protein n=1 Tax=Mesorhizobium captivum TaxID=3072319 RepID=UPI002A24A6C0|nr:hypothetical protein [Mesorhizobium sp. VK22E]MDX8507344.1 hypothetical protein [Mesorhizobium sp. VK22E]
MTFTDKCKLLGRRRGRQAASATDDNKLRAALLPGRQRGGPPLHHVDVPATNLDIFN